MPLSSLDSFFNAMRPQQMNESIKKAERFISSSFFRNSNNGLLAAFLQANGLTDTIAEEVQLGTMDDR